MFPFSVLLKLEGKDITSTSLGPMEMDLQFAIHHLQSVSKDPQKGLIIL